MLIHVPEVVASLSIRLPDRSKLCAAAHSGPSARLSWRRHSLCRVVIEYPAVVGPLVELRDRLVCGKRRRLVALLQPVDRPIDRVTLDPVDALPGEIDIQ